MREKARKSFGQEQVREGNVTPRGITPRGERGDGSCTARMTEAAKNHIVPQCLFAVENLTLSTHVEEWTGKLR